MKEKKIRYTDISRFPGLRVRLLYATNENFTGEVLYPQKTPALLHPLAAEKLKKAAILLKKENPKLCLLVYDVLRPHEVQRRLFSYVKGTAEEKYVAAPYPGSLHNFGVAVDLTLAWEESEKPLDMGTPFDAFMELSEPEKEAWFLQQGRLSPAHVENRRLLRRIMQKSGFLQHPAEWWHYNAVPEEQARSTLPLVERWEDCIY